MVRYAWEGTVTCRDAGGAPLEMWPLAAAHHTILFNRTLNYFSFINTAAGHDENLARIVPFCALGYTILPKETYAHTTDARGVPISMLGYDIKSSRSIQVAFFDLRRGTMRRTFVHVNDVDWVDGTYAFNTELKNLKRDLSRL